jgi:hypothetical protein
MKTLKIVLALTAVIGLVAVTIGLSFAHYTGIPVDTTTNTVHDTFDENWWTNIREYMEAKWNGIEDEAWFNEMTQYMEEHYNEVQNQEWFNQMLEYMEDQGYYRHGGSNFDDNYFGSRNSGRRGFGCWGW